MVTIKPCKRTVNGKCDDQSVHREPSDSISYQCSRLKDLDTFGLKVNPPSYNSVNKSLLSQLKCLPKSSSDFTKETCILIDRRERFCAGDIGNPIFANELVNNSVTPCLIGYITSLTDKSKDVEIGLVKKFESWIGEKMDKNDPGFLASNSSIADAYKWLVFILCSLTILNKFQQ